MKPFLTLSLLFALSTGVEAESKTLLDVVLDINSKTGEFSILISAAVKLDLTGARDGKGPLTVFAPADAAFARLGLDTDNIKMVPDFLLKPIILCHITGGNLLAADIVPESRGWWRGGRPTKPTMLNGGKSFVRNTRGGPRINRSRILTADVEADNGAIHVIDRVLFPLRGPKRG
ncbi:MAG: fasciclin domain-containing protein [Planctomycetota bacterium]|jgi:uncharacterized surface protein with fasciclin (FAS1) repeats